MPAVEIRDAEDRDVDAILSISNAAILETTANWDIEPETVQQRRAWLAERTAAGLPVLVAEIGGEVAGFATYGPFRSRAGYALTVEHSVYLAPRHQGHGAGTALMQELIGRARAAGIHVMIGGIDGANAGSLRFHERLGFAAATPLREVGRKFGRWLDLVFVQLVIADAASPTPSETS